MIRTVALNLDSVSISSVLYKRSMKVEASITEYDSWQEVDYLILCANTNPAWIAKIEELVLPRRKEKSLLVRFSEIRSVEDLSDEREDEKIQLFKPYYSNRKRGNWPQFTEFENDNFFTIGDPLPFRYQPGKFELMSIDEAVLKLAKTYSVGPDQVEIIIRSKPIPLNKNTRETESTSLPSSRQE